MSRLPPRRGFDCFTRAARLALASCAWVAIGAGDARAEPPTATDDGLDAIGEPAARAAAESIGCSSAVARRFFALTLHNLAERRWAMVPASLEDETADLAADAIYDALVRGDTTGEALHRFMSEGRSATCTDAALLDVRRVLANADIRTDETRVDACAKRRLADRRRDPACAVALAARAALQREPEVAKTHAAHFVAASTFDGIYDGHALSEAEKDALFEGIAAALQEVVLTADDAERRPEGPDADRTIDEEIALAFGGIDLDEVDPARCQAGTDLAGDLAAGGGSAQAAFCAATRADLVPDKVAVTLTGPSGATERTTLAGLLHVVTAFGAAQKADARGRDDESETATAILCGLPLTPADRGTFDCNGGKLTAKRGGSFKLEIAGRAFVITLAGAGAATRITTTSTEPIALARFAVGAREAVHVRYDVDALIRERLLGEAPRAEAFRDLAAASLRLRTVARGLEETVDQSGRGGALLAVIDAAPGLVPRRGRRPALACDRPNARPADRAICGTRGAAHLLLAAAEDGRTGDVAARATALLGSVSTESACSRRAPSRLLTAFAAYVPDGDETPVGAPRAPRPLAGAQLRGAARDVAECASEGSAVRGPRTFDELPNPSIRLSWNGAYVNAWGSDGFRVVPTLDAVTLRARLSPTSSALAAGISLSLLDLLAPLTELAMRRGDVDYDRQGLVWLEFLRPRLDATFAVPALSRRVFLVTGVSLRAAAPFLGSIDPASPKPANSATYLTPFTSVPARAERFGNFVEASVGVKYVF